MSPDEIQLYVSVSFVISIITGFVLAVIVPALFNMLIVFLAVLLVMVFIIYSFDLVRGTDVLIIIENYKEKLGPLINQKLQSINASIDAGLLETLFPHEYVFLSVIVGLTLGLVIASVKKGKR